MDRWSERDDDDIRQKGPQGRVAREGIGAFVKQGKEQTQSTSLPAIQGTIEIVASRREQKQQQAAAAMPPPPSRMLGSSRSQTAAATSAGGIPPGVYVEITKSGETVHIPVTKQRILIGRSQEADIVLEHPSSSRQHAIIVYQADSKQWALADSGSAHGTFVNSKQLAKGVPAILKPRVDKFTFGASTRGYMLQQSTNTNTKRSGDLLPVQSSKRFKADDAQFDGDAQLSGDARPDEPRGQFAHLVRSETRPAHSAASPATTSFSSKDRETDSVRTKPDFQKFVASHLKRPPVSPGGLYDMLPPEKSRQSH